MADGPVIIVSGPPGAGKTTLADELASRFPLSVHLATDFFFHAIRSGAIEAWKQEAHDQNVAVVTAAARSAGPFVEAGYAVIVDGVVLPWALEIYRRELAAFDLRCVVLLPNVEEVVRRGLSRPEQHGLDESVYREMHRQFEAAYASHDATLVIRQHLPLPALADFVLQEG